MTGPGGLRDYTVTRTWYVRASNPTEALDLGREDAGEPDNISVDVGGPGPDPDREAWVQALLRAAAEVGGHRPRRDDDYGAAAGQ